MKGKSQPQSHEEGHAVHGKDLVEQRWKLVQCVQVGRPHPCIRENCTFECAARERVERHP